MTLALLALLAQPPPQTYYCLDGSSFQASLCPESAVLNALGRSWMLPKAAAGSGARYSDGSLTLHTKGSEAFVEKAGERIFSGCAAARRPAGTKGLISGSAAPRQGGGFPAGSTLTLRVSDVARAGRRGV